MDWFSKRSPIHNRSTSCRQQTVYCLWKGFEYCRLDGQTPHEERQSAINAYITCLEVKSLVSCWAPWQVVWGSIWPWQILWFCMSDWNLQVDLQAMVCSSICEFWFSTHSSVWHHASLSHIHVVPCGSSSPTLSNSPPCVCHDGQSLNAHWPKVCWTPKESKLSQYITGNRWINIM